MAAIHETQCYRRHEAICLQGDPADRLYILHQGSVGVYVQPGADHPSTADALARGIQVSLVSTPGAIVGESGFFLKHRTASLIAMVDRTTVEHVGTQQGGLRKTMLARPALALTLCRTLAMRLRDMNGHLRNYSLVATGIEQARAEMAQLFVRLGAAIQKRAHSVSTLADLAVETCESTLFQFGRNLLRDRDATTCFFQDDKVRRRSGSVTLQTGQTLVQENDMGRALYYIQAGSLEVVVGQHPVGQLGPGEIVGEVAVLLKESPKRIATVRAAAPTVIRCIPALEFEGLVEKEPKILVSIANALTRRLDTTNHLLCMRSKLTQDAFASIAGGPRSCEAEFNHVLEGLEAADAAEDLQEAARQGAELARQRRDQLRRDYRGSLTS